MIVLLAAAPGAAAKRRVPFGFFGVNTDASTLTGPGGDAQAQLMVRSGVESVRVVFNWNVAQPAPGRGFNFAETDGIVRVATAHGLRVLPIVMYAPRWASAAPTRASYYLSVRNPATYAAYAAALVGRYGPRARSGPRTRRCRGVRPDFHRARVARWRILRCRRLFPIHRAC